MLELYKNIKSIRKSLRMTQDELAHRTGYKDRSSVAKIESGVVDLPQSKIEAFALALGTTPGELMGLTPGADIDNILPLPEVTLKPELGTIACGNPILAEQNINQYISVPNWVECDFVLRCKGDSMIGARIYDGDAVCIRQQPEVENGEIAAVLVDDEATLKRVRLYPDHIVLEPENPAYRPLVYWDEDMAKVRILGKATYFISPVL